jgi:hypothetical protein
MGVLFRNAPGRLGPRHAGDQEVRSSVFWAFLPEKSPDLLNSCKRQAAAITLMSLLLICSENTFTMAKPHLALRHIRAPRVA